MSSYNQPNANGWAPRSDYHAPTTDLGISQGDAAVYTQTPSWAQPHQEQMRHRRDVTRYIVAALGGLGLIAMLFMIWLQAGSVSSIVMPIILAFIPLLIVLTTVRWIDRWEPEPLRFLVLAFLWGAGIATVISLIANTATSLAIYQATGDVYSAESFSAVVSAPLVEEITKGLGVLFIFLVWRRLFNSVVDGVVYAAVVASGFAFAENILYFVTYSDSLAEVFVMRGLASPFAHIIFTSVTGLAIGLSSQRRSTAAWVWMFPLGLVGAICLHAFWNGAVSANPELYFYIEMPLFLACIGIVIWLRRSERAAIRKRLQEYAAAGWFVPQEITMLTTTASRKSALTWAGRRGPQARQAMEIFQQSAMELASLRQLAVNGHAQPNHSAQENYLLQQVRQTRKVFLGIA